MKNNKEPVFSQHPIGQLGQQPIALIAQIALSADCGVSNSQLSGVLKIEKQKNK
ncbi:MAG: hypothetical protein PHW04_05120 [Candidatus Wallbacteria bacterium]|nr:hypothetical protein [Candidatus Wallbacteria bacterium]